jgi:penicillin-binding protein 2
LADQEAPAPDLTARVRLLRVVTVLAFAALVGRLWNLQLDRGSELRRQAEANAFVPREIEADRGVIYDHAGRILVQNSPQFSVSVVPAAMPRDETARWQDLDKLGKMLGIPSRSGAAARPTPGASEVSPAGFEADPASLERVLPRDKSGAIDWSTWAAVPVARNVDRATAFRLMEAGLELPFVSVSQLTVREYPTGSTMGEILGFTGSIPESRLQDYLDRGYQIYDVVGRDGLEATYEQYLRGTKGEKMVEIDSTGRELRALGTPRQPVAGASLKLTMDLDFQQAAQAALARGLAKTGARSGAVVALDPRDGAVRALVSLPNYDNNLFAAGASREDFAALLDDPDRPLVNRAIAGLYPPGSTFKMITASAALQEGVITTKTRIFDPGSISLTNEYDPSASTPFYCWLGSGHGWLDVVGAIANSCNVFFYEVAGGYYDESHRQEGLGSERLGRYARAFGLGQPTQIELNGEAEGRVPTKEWLADWSGEAWTTGLTYEMGIGQANTLATPLQMANVTAAVANGGTLYRPHLVESVTNANGDIVATPGGVLGHVPVSSDYLAAVREGMRGAVVYGTANPAWTQLPTSVAVAGKTGTAIFCDYIGDVAGGPCRRDSHGNLLTHGWFVAFAPADNPEVVVAVLIDGSGLDYLLEGSLNAAPVASEVLRAYFHLPGAVPTGTPCADCTPAAEATPATEPTEEH